MKIAVDFPSVAYREGHKKVLELAEAIEAIGYDEIAAFDHVVMGYPSETRTTIYPAEMPVLEALMLLANLAAVTTTISLSTEVLVLPQRQPVLVAKQISTLDTLSNGRVRLGIGVGWQDSEYDALEEDFHTRGKRMDEAIDLLRAYWAGGQISFQGNFYQSNDMGMEPVSPQGINLPIWVGGVGKAAVRRTAQKGNGWMASGVSDEQALTTVADIREQAEQFGRNPSDIGTQLMLQPPPRRKEDKFFYADLDQVSERAAIVNAMNFDWISINATAVFQSGARSVDAMIEQLGAIYGRLSNEIPLEQSKIT
ncbi:MAG TPA: LLM class F420-dependent oxidoreductase [Acidimicrobiaceae bacterium]|jgi:probable F420-dependent oxidoreductase|nr:LLM class F420-dependent oxidoreductase [Actinomycetota bacterium]HAN07178.1 LLM class F420-dependent oxidoreductase [Acidimicrobiaceae bacterium]|tara:strand:+ start:142 stop:1071 length:930 start_codon:yes stop_codon:yes gene_type:complete